jgi:hypothetical protein
MKRVLSIPGFIGTKPVPRLYRFRIPPCGAISANQKRNQERYVEQEAIEAL